MSNEVKSVTTNTTASTASSDVKFGRSSELASKLFTNINNLRLALGDISNDLMKINSEEKIQRAEEQFSADMKNAAGEIGKSATTVGMEGKSALKLTENAPGPQAGGADAVLGAAPRDLREAQARSISVQGQVYGTGLSGVAGGLAAFDRKESAVTGAQADRTDSLNRDIKTNRDQLAAIQDSAKALMASIARKAGAIAGR